MGFSRGSTKINFKRLKIMTWVKTHWTKKAYTDGNNSTK